MSSARTGLDQLCAAATGISAGAGPTAAEIKVVEVDAYASVADLIHAAILANGGAASLKEIYEVCERNGRIAYRRAGGSRLITSNDHWKSQVRHALYTGDRFRRVSSNSEFWQLTPPHVDNGAELMKVLVRADDPTCSTVAASSQPPSPGRVRSVPGLAKARPSVPPSRRASRLRRKRGSRGDGGSDEDLAEEVSAEAICDSADPGVLGSKTRSVRGVGNIAEGSADHSTQEWDDKVHELPRLRATRTAGRQQAFSFQTPAAQGSPATANRMLSRTVGQRGSGNISRSSDDPSTLRWGSTALRSCITIAADSSLSAGRTPAEHAPPILPRARAPSAEADSPAYFPWFGMPPAAPAAERDGARPAKRRATRPVPRFTMPTPPASNGPAVGTPPLMAQWAEAMQQLQSTMIAQHATPANGSQGAEFVAPGWPQPGVLPPQMMMAMMMAGAAPFLSNQQAQQQMQQQMQAIMLGAAPGALEPTRLSTRAASKGVATQDKTRRGMQ